MLNFNNYGIIDRKLLEDSFEEIEKLSNAEIITGTDKKQLYQQTICAIRIPNETKKFSFENLFKIKGRTGSFYIAQCAIDFGFPPSMAGYPTSVAKYSLQLIGIAKSNIDLGNTVIRPETKIDKLIGHFIHQDIRFSSANQFNNKYFLTSDKKDIIESVFDFSFLNTISKYDGLLLSTRNTEIYISFTTALCVEHGRVIIDVFNAGRFLD